MNAAMLVLVATTMTAPSAPSSQAAFVPARIGQDVTFVADDAAADQQKAAGSPTHQVAGKSMMIMVRGGLVTGFRHTGFDIGAGVGFMPIKNNDKFEVSGDFGFGRAGGVNGFTISFLGQYNIHLTSSKTMPFLGGGLGIGHAVGATNAGFELLGGAQFEMSSGRAIRAELRFLFAGGGTTTYILGGIAF